MPQLFDIVRGKVWWSDLSMRSVMLSSLFSAQANPFMFFKHYFLIKAFMPREVRQSTTTVLRNDLDLVHVVFVPQKPVEPIHCNLEQLLQPPPKRESVKALRDKQKFGHYTRQMIYKRTEKEWKAVPKSYPIAEPEFVPAPPTPRPE
ncbi:unnamed protein product [Gongylonema pulchrum]|uniref:Mitochondrial ribosomal protein L23 n=1 Tax=Gongylonema pulchrum TaxID=637853 RepID=A0A183EUP6_9BILA|nr:unnamed protein product [Gongylonema pulchrum]